jgi:hypothetical protein
VIGLILNGCVTAIRRRVIFWDASSKQAAARIRLTDRAQQQGEPT